MIYKLCAVCQKYFAGELDGSYTCPDCRAREPYARSAAAAAGAGGAVGTLAAPNAPRAA
ncbi:MAG: hypothetical protein ACRD2E_07810 [Terriglobales bacterium]